MANLVITKCPDNTINFGIIILLILLCIFMFVLYTNLLSDNIENFDESTPSELSPSKSIEMLPMGTKPMDLSIESMKMGPSGLSPTESMKMRPSGLSPMDSMKTETNKLQVINSPVYQKNNRMTKCGSIIKDCLSNIKSDPTLSDIENDNKRRDSIDLCRNNGIKCFENGMWGDTPFENYYLIRKTDSNFTDIDIKEAPQYLYTEKANYNSDVGSDSDQLFICDKDKDEKLRDTKPGNSLYNEKNNVCTDPKDKGCCNSCKGLTRTQCRQNNKLKQCSSLLKACTCDYDNNESCVKDPKMVTSNSFCNKFASNCYKEGYWTDMINEESVNTMDAFKKMIQRKTNPTDPLFVNNVYEANEIISNLL